MTGGRDVLALGDELERSVACAQREVVLVAPFVKHAVLARLLRGVSASVDVTLITRWRAVEVAAGVSDLEVFEVMESCPGARLLLHNPLHAKVYLADGTAFVGSANLTHAALGWGSTNNTEFTVRLPAVDVVEFLAFVRGRCVRATRIMRDAVRDAADALPEAPSVIHPEAPAPATSEVEPTWWPRLRDPALLENAAAGEFEVFSAAGREAALHDLARMALSSGLPRAAFRALVRAHLLQHPWVAQLQQRSPSTFRFGELRYLGAPYLGFTADQDFQIQTMLRWLTYFAPEHFLIERRRHAERIHVR